VSQIGLVTLVVCDYDEATGTLAVFEDLYGNRWDLIEAARPG